MTKPCSIDGCEKPSKCRGYCNNHYALWYRNGTPYPIKPIPDRPSVCSVEWCNRRHSAHGYCSMHAMRWKKYGTTDLPEKVHRSCSVPGCVRSDYKAKGMCHLHYDRCLRGVDLNAPIRKRQKSSTCSVEGCCKKPRARGLCDKHLQRFYKNGDPHKTLVRVREKPWEWEVMSSGYVSRIDPDDPSAGSNGTVYQHRHVMSQMIGRPLNGDENVHHKNGIRDDNRPENLELWSKSQPAGQRVTDKVSWCMEYLMENADTADLLDPEFREKVASMAKAFSA